MPETRVVFFAAKDGSAPLLDWLDEQAPKVQDKCLVRIERLAELGHEMRRPEADYLRDGIYELRVRFQQVHFRMLYFFHEGAAVLSHGFRKEGKVPDREIKQAIQNRREFEKDMDGRAYQEDIDAREEENG